MAKKCSWLFMNVLSSYCLLLTTLLCLKVVFNVKKLYISIVSEHYVRENSFILYWKALYTNVLWLWLNSIFIVCITLKGWSSLYKFPLKMAKDYLRSKHMVELWHKFENFSQSRSALSLLPLLLRHDRRFSQQVTASNFFELKDGVVVSHT